MIFLPIGWITGMEMDQPDIPAPRRACYGLRPGAPCPAHDDGTWPEGCDCMKLRTYSGSLTWAAVGIGLAIFLLLFIGIWAIVDVAFGADNSQPCLTKEQARAKWRTEWIYWHGSNHCWDNVRGSANTANKADGTVQIIRAPKPNRATKAGREDTTPLDASGNQIRGPSIYFPDLMPGTGVDGTMMRADSMSQWPVLMDVDAPSLFLPWQKRISFLTRQERP